MRTISTIPSAADGPADATSFGDDAWFSGLFTRHSADIYRYFYRRAAHDDVEDLTAEVFATAWRRRADLPAGAELPWLYRTAGFILANHRRKGRPVPVGEVPEFGGDHDASNGALDSEAVRQVLSVLSPRDRQVLVLAAWEGLRGNELAAVLGISRGAADAALFRARGHLAKAWAELGLSA